MQDRSDTKPETIEAELMTTEAEATATGGKIEDSDKRDEDQEVPVQTQKLKGILKERSSSQVEEIKVKSIVNMSPMGRPGPG